MIEKDERNYSAEFHLDGLRQDGLPIPKPSSAAEYVEVADEAA